MQCVFVHSWENRKSSLEPCQSAWVQRSARLRKTQLLFPDIHDYVSKFVLLQPLGCNTLEGKAYIVFVPFLIPSLWFYRSTCSMWWWHPTRGNTVVIVWVPWGWLQLMVSLCDLESFLAGEELLKTNFSQLYLRLTPQVNRKFLPLLCGDPQQPSVRLTLTSECDPILAHPQP